MSRWREKENIAIGYNEQVGRVPPQAVEVEEAILGGMLVDDDAVDVVLQMIRPDDFYKPANKHVFETIADLHRQGKPTDLISVENHLRDHNLLDVIGGSGQLAEYTRSVSSLATIENHCLIVAEKSVKRNLIISCQEVIKQAYDTTADAVDTLDLAMKHLDEITDRTYRRQGEFVSDMIGSVVEDILQRRETKGLTGIGTGTILDKYTGGWQPANLYIIAARPSIGKTAFILNSAFNAALFSTIEATGFYANMEMKNADLIQRRLALESRVNYTKMRDGKISDEDVTRILEASEALTRGRLIIDDTTNLSINEFRAKYKTAVRRHGVQFGVVDYLQLMAGNKEGNREQEISSISRGLKAVAKETNTPIIALSQLSRACENRTGAEPYLSDLRESGSIEQDADGVILLNRPEFFNHGTYKNKPTAGKGWVKVAKMRNGMTGEFMMDFDKGFALWKNPYGEYEQFQAHMDEDLKETAPQPHQIDYEDDETPF